MNINDNNTLKAVIGLSTCTATICGIAGRYVKSPMVSPTLHKVGEIATCMAIVGGACYAYLNLGNPITLLKNHPKWQVVKDSNQFSAGQVAYPIMENSEMGSVSTSASRRDAHTDQNSWREPKALGSLQQTLVNQVLNEEILTQARNYLETPSKLETLPRARFGSTPVYFPENLPIILKKSGEKCEVRVEQMRAARAICKKNRYERLVIPEAQECGKFIIESRIPITEHGTKEQIGFYIENREKFTEAVKEFTGFLCQSDEFDDITGGNHDPYQTLFDVPLGRYDNVPLYLEANQGKIGLIDLEGFEPGIGSVLSACKKAIHLFPYHLNEIISVAKKFDQGIEVHRKYLEGERDKSLNLFKLAYVNHLEFVRKKGINLQNPISFPPLGEVQIEQTKKAIQDLLRMEHEGFWYKGCLNKNPDETLHLFNQHAFPQVLDATYNFIAGLLERNLEKARGESDIHSNVQLISIRTLEFSHDDPEYLEYRSSISKILQSVSIDRNPSGLLISAVLKEMVKGDAISYYNSEFGYGSYATQCIWC